MNPQGKLIVIEGADGAGKATQTKLLVERLQAEGQTIETLDFPQYTHNHFGQLIREVLDKHGALFVDLPPKVASALTAADRFESKSKIEDWLQSGKVVILDRYASSNMLHQGAKVINPEERTTFMQWLHHMEHSVFGIPEPDMILYLAVPAKRRQELLFSDYSRSVVDAAEQSSDHQAAADACAQELIATYGWHEIICTDTDNELRSREAIHEDVYAVVTSII